ncbi:MAG: S-methyl-5-thioribose-1-phosphate isomerase [Candidatus Omnitrophota bacterium]|nr:S-methyl-5-thioribose-1-phosphate isomerase [Candidatus Omnitrophota bacterium]MBU1928681.1 S-methyl-5-thioribose-1-phosphate isomerase [Candidatus Omnitrophota bacterium]MBU2035754.1 S-methyl-5-thioribose-1-phosphate isomerase [Candidatus Omnitrophota bacterium]MBU2258519.1 S-methyl-5-thioribose-1-phosphate isomerase [Candidatus Omnitrophota bacterium]
MKFSPLFWPIRFEKGVIYVLDETALPDKLTYMKVKDYKQACKAIKEMKTRAVGQVLLVMCTFLLEISKINKTGNMLPVLEKVSSAINAARPTLPFKMLTDMVLGWAKQSLPLERNILGFLEMLKNKRIQQAKEAALLLKDKDVILTHCNISGLMPLIGEFCRKQSKELSFFVTETRPYLQGSRLSAWELKHSGFEVTIISDNMAAQVMSEGRINKIIVGADHLAGNGDIANKIGTFQLAILARYFKIPFFVLCPPKSSVKTGKEIKIEIRPDKELLEFCGRRIAPKGVKGYYPAFDITPAGFITKHIYLDIKR